MKAFCVVCGALIEDKVDLLIEEFKKQHPEITVTIDPHFEVRITCDSCKEHIKWI